MYWSNLTLPLRMHRAVKTLLYFRIISNSTDTNYHYALDALMSSLTELGQNTGYSRADWICFWSAGSEVNVRVLGDRWQVHQFAVCITRSTLSRWMDSASYGNQDSGKQLMSNSWSHFLGEEKGSFFPASLQIAFW